MGRNIAHTSRIRSQFSRGGIERRGKRGEGRGESEEGRGKREEGKGDAGVCEKNTPQEKKTRKNLSLKHTKSGAE